MRTTTPNFRMADRLAKGKLAETLLEHERLGYSPDYSARVLFADFGIETTRTTVAAWREMARPEEHDEAVG